MRRLVIVCDHPSLHRGFSSVGAYLARHLHASGRWLVQYIGRYPRAKHAPGEPYPVFDVHSEQAGVDEGGRLRHLLRQLLGSRVPETNPPLLLSIGSPSNHRDLVDRLDELNLRSDLRLVSYMPIDSTPLPATAAELFRRFDVLVPYSSFGGRAARAACRDSETPRISAPIPHGVDVETFRPPRAEQRKATRARLFGLGEDDLLIGFFGRNSGHKHPDLALRIFAAFAMGAYVQCGRCGCVTAHEPDCFGALGRAPRACPSCAGEQLDAGTANERAVLYLHTELLGRRERRYSRGWDLEAIARRLGVEEKVHFERALRIGEGIPATELSSRMGACDIHLLPYDAGGWELTVLETGACGVPNLITATAAPPEYATPFSEVVAPATRLPGPAGDRAIIDPGRAIEALRRLAGSPGYRAKLGRRGVEVAVAHSWQEVGRSWDRLLSEVASVTQTGA